MSGSSASTAVPDRGSLLHDQVEDAEHHDRDDHRGDEQRQREHGEARLARAARALGAAFGRPPLGGAAQRLTTMALERRLLGERLLEVAETLTHLHEARRVATSRWRGG